MARFLLMILAIAAASSSAAAISVPDHRLPLPGRAMAFGFNHNKFEPKPPAILKGAYTAVGTATTLTWANIVRTTIRSNQPVGAMMPSVQHGIFGKTSVLSAVPLIVASYGILTKASDSWDSLRSDTCRRLNLALATATAGGALWIQYAEKLTAIPNTGNTVKQVSHQCYKGLPKAVMMGSYLSAAALSAAVWTRTLPEDVKNNPIKCAQRVADGVCQSLASIGPKCKQDMNNVKYSLLTTSFLVLTALQLGTFPTAVVPSWTGRRLSRHFPAWTFLAAASAFNLKEATEDGRLFSDSQARDLSKGLAGMGAVYLTAKFGSVFLDPSWPGHYALVTKAPAWQLGASMMFGLTLRPDEKKKAPSGALSDRKAAAKDIVLERRTRGCQEVLEESPLTIAASIAAGYALAKMTDGNDKK